MAFKRNAGNHAFNGAGGKCAKCDMTCAAYLDKDSKDYQQPCPGQKQEAQKPIAIEE
jgi:hypothetical protein